MYHLRAYAKCGDKIVYGDDKTFTTTSDPGAPVIGPATAGNAQATVTFTAPADDGGLAITGYTVTSNPGDKTASGSTSPLTVTGLTNSIAYTFTVTATNANGTGLTSTASNSVTPSVPITVPSATTIGTATAGNGLASVKFTAPDSDGGSAITGYTVTSNPGGLTATGSASPITVTGLSNGTAYTFTVTATNAIGAGIPSMASNSITPEISATIFDIDGNIYNTVTIGTQVWMAENLKTTKYNDNTEIPNISENTAWGALTTPGYCGYNNDAVTFKATYGALYNWFTVDVANNGGKNVCPTGWHVPSDEEWTVLTDYLGGEAGAGGKLKETGTGHWYYPNTGAINETGFTALPAGARIDNGLYNPAGYNGFWWSSTEQPESASAWFRSVDFGYSSVSRNQTYKQIGFSVRCLQGEPIIIVPSAPTIGPASAGIGQATVTFTAPVNDGGSVITGYTVTSSPGGISSTGMGSPISVIGLTNRTVYTFTVTATNANGKGWSSASSNSVTPKISETTISDIDGNNYYTVNIGTQVWMAENLKTTKYNDNTEIPLVADNTAWSVLSTPGYSWYFNDENAYKAIYGALYNWFSVDAISNGGKNICPSGWHVPSDEEWSAMINYLGGDFAGGKLKEISTTLWHSPNTGATNETGFTALPGGDRTPDGIWFAIGISGTWWSSTMLSTTDARSWNISYASVNLGWHNSYKQYGFSVRCVRDF